jgi:hypothetical protein
VTLDAAGLRAALVAAARAGRPVSYLQLADSLLPGEPRRIHRITLLLEELLREDLAAGRPLLAALAVGRAGLPGRGFFLLLGELGAYGGPDSGPEAAQWHAAALARAVDHWGAER